MKSLHNNRIRLFVAVGIIAALIAIAAISILCLKARNDVITAKRLMITGLTLSCYRDSHRSFPPAYVCDAAGKPTHSWRVLILPELGYEDLFKKFDFNKPWDDPLNLKLVSEIPIEYQAPYAQAGYTDIVAVVHTPAWPGASPANLKNKNVGLGNLILLVQARKTRVWTEPDDLTSEEVLASFEKPDGLAGLLGPTRHFALANATVMELPTDITKEEMRSLLTGAISAWDRSRE